MQTKQQLDDISEQTGESLCTPAKDKKLLQFIFAPCRNTSLNSKLNTNRETKESIEHETNQSQHSRDKTVLEIDKTAIEMDKTAIEMDKTDG